MRKKQKTGTVIFLRNMTVPVLLLIVAAGCGPWERVIPGIPKDHPAQEFYRFVSLNPVTDKVCKDHQGNPMIPAGKVMNEEGYQKLNEVTEGVLRFKDLSNGKTYFGVSYLQYQGMLQLPKLCAWEEDPLGESV